MILEHVLLTLLTIAIPRSRLSIVFSTRVDHKVGQSKARNLSTDIRFPSGLRWLVKPSSRTKSAPRPGRFKCHKKHLNWRGQVLGARTPEWERQNYSLRWSWPQICKFDDVANLVLFSTIWWNPSRRKWKWNLRSTLNIVTEKIDDSPRLQIDVHKKSVYSRSGYSQELKVDHMSLFSVP